MHRALQSPLMAAAARRHKGGFFALGQDFTGPFPGDGLSHPEQKGS